MREVNKIDPSDRSKWQCCLAANWFIADFVHEAAMECEAREALERDNARIDNDTANPSMKPRKTKNKGKGKAPAPMQTVVEGSYDTTANINAPSVRNPTWLSSPEEWAAYLASPSGAKTPLAGVYWRHSDRAIIYTFVTLT
ncbi:hypothetical protein BDP27DRAFT_1431418 [Rhodocollybia butyracea]|uniref:Uncharacterized protein n=1 Tax=Rhodocollybia butyracea TaxID=206335 RepID=A0A9P5TYN5_9AGAR|nr:hypothetical protein BDP27DRAFT_1431418 [Rhodocollybia butyracea]